MAGTTIRIQLRTTTRLKMLSPRSVLFSILIVAAMISSIVVESTPSRNSNGSNDFDAPGTSSNARIVGGTMAEPGDYPYFVEMGGCGGALVAPDVVLFAAHCGDWTGQQVTVGAYETKRTTGGAKPRFCETWIPDPLYGTGGNGDNYDFALCKLDEPVVDNIDESAITLELNEEASVPVVGDDLLVMGLGTLYSAGPSPKFLHHVTVPYVTNEECNGEDSYGGKYYDGVITESMLCAGYIDEGRKDSCQGDSGGPIVKRIVKEDGTIVDVHVGVVSWGLGCARKKYPGVYARTSASSEWIKETICSELKSVASFCDNDDNDPPKELSCNDGEDELIIHLTTDSKARQTEWTLYDSNSNEIMYRQYLVKNFENKHRVCLQQEECYSWKIEDWGRHGLCNSSHDCGSYSFVLNGEEIISRNGDSFEDERVETFCATDTQPPTESPTPFPTCGNEANQYQIKLKTDDYGWESVVSTYPFNEDFTGLEDPIDIQENFLDNTVYLVPGEEKHYCLEQGRCYFFAIVDTWGDGMTVEDGYFEGYLGGQAIFSGDGKFNFFDSRIFCTGDVCKDNDAFAITRKKLNCKAFLKGKKKKIRKRCSKTWNGAPVHSWCPETCGEKAGRGKCRFMMRKNHAHLKDFVMSDVDKQLS